MILLDNDIEYFIILCIIASSYFLFQYSIRTLKKCA